MFDILFFFSSIFVWWKCNVNSVINSVTIFTYLHGLSSKPEKPGIPDKLVWDDGWFETYGYILLAGVDSVADVELERPSSELAVDVANDKFMPLLFVFICVWLLLLLLLFNCRNDATEFSCELVNGWNCG